MKTNLEKLREIYDSLPKLRCKQLCQESCGPIMYAPAEHRAILDAHGMEPAVNAELTCTFLREGGCIAYDNRPLICRLWGMVKAMRCPHGCTPERWLSDEQAGELLEQIQDLEPGELHSTISRELLAYLVQKPR